MGANWNNSEASVEKDPCFLRHSSSGTLDHLYLSPHSCAGTQALLPLAAAAQKATPPLSHLPLFRSEVDRLVMASIILKNERQEKYFTLKVLLQSYPRNLGAMLAHAAPSSQTQKNVEQVVGPAPAPSCLRFKHLQH